MPVHTIHEGTAELGRLYSFRELVPSDGYKGFSSPDVEQFLYESHLVETFRHIRFTDANPYGHAAFLRLHY